MDKKSKIFFSIFFLVIFLVAVISFYKFYILKDYYITSEAVCDPARENCFIYECNPSGGDCSEDPNERVSYYKLIEKRASALPLCDPNDSACPSITCRAGEDCREILCDETTITAGEQCSKPPEYLNNRKQIQKVLNLN